MEKVEETLLCPGAGVLLWFHENIKLPYFHVWQVHQSFIITLDRYDARLELCHGWYILV